MITGTPAALAANRPGLGGVRVYDGGPLAAKNPKERQKRTEVPERREQPGHAPDLGDLHSAFPGVVGHVSLVLGDAARDQARAKANGIEGSGQVHHVHGRSTRVEACDETVNEDRGDRSPHSGPPFTIHASAGESLSSRKADVT